MSHHQEVMHGVHERPIIPFDKIAPIHEAQLLTYLKLTNLKLGFLLNWNVPLMKDGIRRMVNNLNR